MTVKVGVSMIVKSLVSLLVLGLAGCGAAHSGNDEHGVHGAADQTPGITGDTAVLDANDSNAKIPPVASLRVSNGNRVDFFDGGKDGILIAELGKAYTTPVLKGIDMNALSAVDTWNKLSPTIPAPQALVELQARADAYAEAAGNSPTVDGPPVEPTTGGGPDASTITTADGVSAVQQADNACNNGCCDANWLLNSLCDQNGKFHWFNFNYGWSWVQNNSIYELHETTCAGIGVSQFGIHRGSYTNSFFVFEAHYQTYNWKAGFFSGNSDNHSVVNASSNNQPVNPTNLHTFCGAVNPAP
jgi:hypothetical protein